MAGSAVLYLIFPLAHRFYQVAILLALIEIAFTTLHLSAKSLLAGLPLAGQRGAAYVVTYILFIDSIARDDMKSAYFGAQNFAMLGGGLSSIVCGMILANRGLAPG